MQSRSSRRLFFALWPEPAVRDALAATTRTAVATSKGKAVPAANLHITLAFLHLVSDDRQPCIRDAARKVAEHRGTFSLVVDRYGYWPRSRILYAGLSSKCDELDALVRALWDALANCGFTPERRTFRPHVTLARKAANVDTEVLAEPVPWSVQSFALVESVTGQRVSTYRVLDEWRFGER